MRRATSTITTGRDPVAPLLLAGGLVATGACYGGVSEFDGAAPSSTAADGASDDPESALPDDPAASADAERSSRLWRLTARQYERTIESAVPIDFDLSSIAFKDRTEEFINDAHDLGIDEVFFSTIEDVVGATVSANIEPIADALSCSLDALDAACLAPYVETLTRAAQRTPDADIGAYLELFEALRADGDPAAALGGVVTAVLISPQTLFRSERGALGPDGINRLTPFERADFLAYTLWDGPPDEELLALAADGSLARPEVLETQIERMLAAPEGNRGLTEFLNQWLGLVGLEHLDKNTTVFPEYAALRPSMMAETQRFIAHVLEDEGADLSVLLGSSKSFVDAPLADFYGVELPAGQDQGWVELPADERRGVFTQPAVISAMSEATLTGVIYRGKALLGRLVCNVVVAPPDIEFPTFEDFPPEATTRERMESIEFTEPCSACHVSLHPPSFAMETYDAMGRFRDTENGSPIDASGALEAGDELVEFAHAPDLLGQLASSEAVRACFTRQAFRYVAGAHERVAERPFIEATAARFVSDPDIRRLFADLTLSLALRERTVEENDECDTP